MRYYKLIRFHSYFILGKLTIIIFVILLTIFIVLFLITSGSFDELGLQDLNRESYKIEYQSNMMLAVKMIGTIISCFLYGFSLLKHQDSYYVYCLSKTITKKDYIITKLVTITLIYIAFILLVLCLYLGIGLVVTPWFIIEAADISFFLLFIIQGSLYGIFTVLLTLLFHNLYVSTITYGMFIVNEIITESISSTNEVTLFVSIMKFMFPSIITVDGNHFLLFGTIQAIVWILVVVIAATSLYIIKETPA